jgi:aconitate hydratase
VASLSAMDRHVIANMGAELGATTSVFPSDEEVRRFLDGQGRGADWVELVADDAASYDVEDAIDLGSLEPLIAMPQSPGHVKPVREVAGEPIYQAYVGSSANPGFRDFAVVAEIVKGRTTHDRVSFDVNPTSRQILRNLADQGHLGALIAAGARIHQAGCNGCIGMGQAPATGRISLRTVPRNFPGRSGTREDAVCLVGPETAAASALTGEITDPRTLEERLGMAYPQVREPEKPILVTDTLVPPASAAEATDVELEKGPNIASIPELEGLPERLELPVLLAMGDDVSTDEILPAGARVLPFRSNIPEIAKFSFEVVDDTYPERARETGDHAVVGGDNYGQGSSREHAALAPRTLGLRLVVARGFARIHRQNLANYGVLPLTFAEPEGRDRVEAGDVLVIEEVARQLREGDGRVEAHNASRDESLDLRHRLSQREIEMIEAGGLINVMRRKLSG